MARVVFFLIGCLLCVTAFLKLWMLMTDPFADISAQMPRTLLWTAFFIELFAVILLFSRYDFELKWAAIFLIFAGFWVFSLTRWVMGYTSCGCSGGILLPPWVSLIVNTAMIGLLILVRPKAPVLVATFSRWSSEFNTVQNRGRALAFVVAILLLAMAQTETGLGFFGLAPGVTGRVADLPKKLDIGKAVEIHATLKSRIDQPVSILGFSRSCTCIADSLNVPRSIPPMGQVEFSIRVTPHQTGRFRQRVICYVNVPGQNSVPLDLDSFVR